MLHGRSRYFVAISVFLLMSCEKVPEYQVPLTLEPQYTYIESESIPELNRRGYLLFNTTALSKTPLHKIYDEYRFHYAHFKCPINDQFEVAGFISANDSEYEPIIYDNNHYKYDVSFTICPENDASKLECINESKQLKTLPQQLSCRVVFGRMFGRSVVISDHIQMDIFQLAQAKQFHPPESLSSSEPN